MSGLFLVTGDDEAAIGKEARRLVDAAAGPDADEFSLEIFKQQDDQDPDDLLDRLLGSMLTPPLFGGSKTMWLQNFQAFAGSDKRSLPVALQAAAKRLAEALQSRFPDDVTLVLSGPAITIHKELTEACRQVGKVVEFSRPDITDRNWRGQIMNMIAAETQERGMTLGGDCVEYLIEVIGVDTGRLANEIEKVYCYAGAKPTLQDLQQICSGTREAAYFALSNALGDRDLNGAMQTIRHLLDNSRRPEDMVLGLVRQTYKFFHQLLEAKLLALQLRAGRGRLGDAVTAAKASNPEALAGNSLAARHPYFLTRLGEQAARYSGPEIVAAIGALAEVDRYNVSSALPRRMLLEDLALRITRRA